MVLKRVGGDKPGIGVRKVVVLPCLDNKEIATRRHREPRICRDLAAELPHMCCPLRPYDRPAPVGDLLKRHIRRSLEIATAMGHAALVLEAWG